MHVLAHCTWSAWLDLPVLMPHAALCCSRGRQLHTALHAAVAPQPHDHGHAPRRHAARSAPASVIMHTCMIMHTNGMGQESGWNSWFGTNWLCATRCVRILSCARCHASRDCLLPAPKIRNQRIGTLLDLAPKAEGYISTSFFTPASLPASASFNTAEAMARRNGGKLQRTRRCWPHTSF